MSSAFTKDVVRSIRGSLGRFLAIAGIVALGCGFYAGLRMTAPDMDLAADEYYDENALMDIRVVSTMGLTQADIDALRDVPDVAAVEGAYEVDALTDIGAEQYTVRIHSLVQGMNQLVLAEGAWPAAAGECVISADKVMAVPVTLGDKITLLEGSQDLADTLKVREYTIVGFVHSPYYVSTTAMGSTTVGTGEIEQYLYVPAGDFDDDLPFTEAYVKVEGAEGELSGGADYQARVDVVLKGIEGIAAECEQRRLADIKAEAQTELDDARAEYERERADAERELADARAKLDDAQAKIAASERQIASGQSEHDAGAAKLESERAQAAAKLDAAQKELDDKASQLAAQKESATAQRAQLAATEAQLAQALAANPDNAALKQQLAQVQAGLKQADAGLAQIAQGEQQVAQGRQQLADQRTAADAQMAQAQAQLDSAAAQIASGRTQLAQGRADYVSGTAEYEKARAEADEEFAKAERELADAQADIDAIETPEWLIMDRTKNHGVVSFESDADRVDSIAAFFPFIFFLVAALVALTTMTRMVEEERVLIGTFKALGYSRARITSKYLIYAAAASITGAIIGIVVLSLVLPPVIMEAYAIIYTVPHGLIMPIDAPIALTAAGLGVGVTLFATWAAASATLRETPANLMRPRAPKEGKRILLERITPVWRRMTFSWKVTFRNIFRYKKRLIMTVIGIAGCTGLLLTGLGLQDSINDIIDKQFGVTKLYNVEVTGDGELSPEAREQLDALADGSAYELVESMKASGPAKSDVSVSLVVPEDPQAYQSMWVMRDRVTGDPIALEGGGAVITEKLGNLLGIGVGDEVELAEQDKMGNATSDVHRFTVSGIMENYIANYVFVTPEGYETAFGEPPVFSTMVGLVGEGEEAHAAFRDAASQVEGVKTVAFNDETIDTYRSMLRSVNMIVVVLVVAAAVLAFIVLYNLTNINITERQREIATLKVLGFNTREVDLYIYREILILTVLGALVGLVFGAFLEGLVVVTAEVDYVMFGREIHPTSYIVAFVVTIIFALVVMLSMRRKLAKIDMVESLKSNE